MTPKETEKDVKPINEFDALNIKYFNIFNRLKKASPSLANCDAAFLSFVQNITEQYEAEYKQLFGKGETTKTEERIEKINALNERFYFMGERLKANKEKIPEGLFAFMKDAMQLEYQKQYELLAGEYDSEMDRKIAENNALHERIVPQRWTKRFLLFFKRKKQNYAADLVDIEANEKAGKIFAEQEAEIAKRVAERQGAEDLASAFKEKLKAYAEEQLAEAQRLAENAENAQDGQEVGNAKRGAESASEGNSEGAGTTKAEEAEKPQSAADKAMKEYLNKKNRKKGKG